MMNKYMIGFFILMVVLSLLGVVNDVTAVQSDNADITLKIGESLMFDGDTGVELRSYDKNYFTKSGNKKTGTILKAKKTGNTKIKIYVPEIDTTITSTVKITKK